MKTDTDAHKCTEMGLEGHLQLVKSGHGKEEVSKGRGKGLALLFTSCIFMF